MKKVNSIISFLLSLLLMFSIMFTCFLFFYRNVLINQKYYSEIFINEGAIEEIYSNLNTQIKYVLVENNVPKKYFDEIISKDEIIEEMTKNIENTEQYFLSKTDTIPDIDTTKYTDRLQAGFDNYVQTNNVEVTEEMQGAFNDIKSDADSKIKNEVTILLFKNLDGMNGSDKVRKVLTLLNDTKILAMLIGVDVIISLILLVIWKKISLAKGFSWIGSATFSNGLLLTLVFFSGYMSKFYDNVAINPQYFAVAISSVTKGYILKLLSYGVISLVIGLIIMVASFVLYNKNKEKSLN